MRIKLVCDNDMTVECLIKAFACEMEILASYILN